MANCDIFDSCPFAQGQLTDRAGEVEQLKEAYCDSNSLHCARYMIHSSLGADKVPGDLYPDQKDKAYLVIAENG